MSIVLNGQTSQLLKDGSGNWFTDDASLGWKVEQVTGSPNGVKDGESFKVTTMDGTQYFFGSRVRGGVGAVNGGGAMRMPVFFHDEPSSACYSAVGFQYAYCPNVGYRWNLDFVKDRFGNTMTYNYQFFSGKYGVANGSANIEYDVSAQLQSIEFGANATSGAGASGKATFIYAYRCLDSVANCDTYHDGGEWPDTPWDQFCYLTDSTCPGRTSPTFWTPFRLSKIETQAYDYVTGNWALTDQLNLVHIFPATGDYISPAGDDTPPSLWMQTLTRQFGETVFTAGGIRLANRVFWGNDLARSPMMHYRIDNIYWGTGGHTTVSYSGEECTRTNVYNGATDHNVLKCYPQWEDDQFRWYHKYVVTQVSDQDMAASGNPAVVTRYVYTFDHVTSTQGPEYAAAMWRFDDNWLTPMSRRTFSKWRGYPTVLTYTGAADGTGLQTLAQDVYFRGMNGDRSGGVWGARQVSVSDGTTTYTDHEGMAAKLLRHTTFDTQSGGVWRDMQITKYTAWAAGTMSTFGGNPPAYNAWKVLPTQSQTILNIPGSSYTRTTTVNTTYDTTYPLVTKVEDLGETQATTNAVGSADDKCTTTSYVPADTTRWLIGFPKEMLTTDCTGGISASKYLAGQHFYYDGQAFGVLGAGAAMGKLSKTESLQAVTNDLQGPVFSWLTTGQNTVYDTYGRATTTIDAAGRSTITAYTPAVNVTGAVKTIGITTTGTVPTTISLGTTTTELDIRFGTPAKITDVNSKVTQAQYDWHGYLTDVWKNHRAPAGTAGITPDAHYTYMIRGNLPSYVATKLLAADGTSQYLESFDYYDGLLRPRKTETPGANGTNRGVTDTLYGPAGQTTRVLSVSLTGNPNPNFDGWNTSAANRDEQYGYDGFGQQKSVAVYSQGVALGSGWNTTAVTDGRTTTVTPPQGGTVATTITNALGQTTELRQAKPGGGTVNTTYTYDRLGQLKTVKDPLNNTWTYSYDLLGRQTSAADPDTGTSTTSYYSDGLVSETVGGNGSKLAFGYDSLGRRTGIFEDSLGGVQRAGWTYDSVQKGQLSSAVRFDGGLSYTQAVTSYDNGYRPLEVKATIPVAAANGALAGDYITKFTYTGNGALWTHELPAAGGLLGEKLTYAYNSAGQADSVSSTVGTTTSPLIAGTVYNYDGTTASQTLGATGKRVKNTYTYQLATSRLLTAVTSTENAGNFDPQLTKAYSYDPAGNITESTEDLPGSTSDSKECFTYDSLRRLTEAWTQAFGAAACTPQRAGVDPYRRQWTFDDAGNRLTQKDIDPAVGDTTWTYTYPASGTASVRPHSLTQITSTGPKATASRAFTYDNGGNNKSRATVTGASQLLDWDKEGHLKSATEGANATAYLYTADGTRLIARDSTGTTLYLGSTEVRLPSSGGQPLGTRLLGVAVRSASGLQWIATDQSGTGQIGIDSVSLTIDRRRLMPYGEQRSGLTNWPANRGFVGGTTDSTGLTHLSAREYDATTGQFISADPIHNLTETAAETAYAYASHNPITFLDASGLATARDRLERGNVQAHATAIALRATALSFMYPGAIVSADLLNERGEGDLVCWNCSAIMGGPDVVWVWEVKPAGYSMNDGVAQAEKHARQIALKYGVQTQLGPMFAFPQTSQNHGYYLQRVTVTSQAPGFETYRTDDDRRNERKGAVSRRKAISNQTYDTATDLDSDSEFYRQRLETERRKLGTNSSAAEVRANLPRIYNDAVTAAEFEDDLVVNLIQAIGGAASIGRKVAVWAIRALVSSGSGTVVRGRLRCKGDYELCA